MTSRTSSPPPGGRYTLRHFFFFNDTATTEIYTLSLHDALPICFLSNAGSRDFRRPPNESAHCEEDDGPEARVPALRRRAGSSSSFRRRVQGLGRASQKGAASVVVPALCDKRSRDRLARRWVRTHAHMHR